MTEKTFATKMRRMPKHSARPLILSKILAVVLLFAFQHMAMVCAFHASFTPQRQSRPLMATTADDSMLDSTQRTGPPTTRSKQRNEWIKRSTEYYEKITRQERIRNSHSGKADNIESETFQKLARQHYFAYQKIKRGEFNHAEKLYRRIIEELWEEDAHEGGCDHAKLAVTTLLLALHLQRMGDTSGTRIVFHRFFCLAITDRSEDTECACSAKVLGAYALFEFKNGNKKKALRLAQMAASFDEDLEAVLRWKQFRELI
mmetsp:Transcript_23007/g.64116  ORF Transcript_23007/g.64116 Transcript_23007/m.64116 type:complete len:259 (-) Transcript_23007:179-955(-)